MFVLRNISSLTMSEVASNVSLCIIILLDLDTPSMGISNDEWSDAMGDAMSGGARRETRRGIVTKTLMEEAPGIFLSAWNPLDSMLLVHERIVRHRLESKVLVLVGMLLALKSQHGFEPDSFSRISNLLPDSL
jgi:hypothetical protein